MVKAAFLAIAGGLFVTAVVAGLLRSVSQSQPNGLGTSRSERTPQANTFERMLAARDDEIRLAKLDLHEPAVELLAAIEHFRYDAAVNLLLTKELLSRYSDLALLGQEGQSWFPGTVEIREHAVRIRAAHTRFEAALAAFDAERSRILLEFARDAQPLIPESGGANGDEDRFGIAPTQCDADLIEAHKVAPVVWPLFHRVCLEYLSGMEELNFVGFHVAEARCRVVRVSFPSKKGLLDRDLRVRDMAGLGKR